MAVSRPTIFEGGNSTHRRMGRAAPVRAGVGCVMPPAGPQLGQRPRWLQANRRRARWRSRDTEAGMKAVLGFTASQGRATLQVITSRSSIGNLLGFNYDRRTAPAVPSVGGRA